MQGVKGLCGAVVDIRTGISIILARLACGNVDLGLFPGSEYLTVAVCSAVDWVDVGLGG